jgi:hypothetical protein
VGAAALHAEVVVFQVDFEIRQDQLVLDKAPDDPAISSPSSATTGRATLIFAIAKSSHKAAGKAGRLQVREDRGGAMPRQAREGSRKGSHARRPSERDLHTSLAAR